MEVPLLFPTLTNDLTPRYRIYDVDGRVNLISRQDVASDSAGNDSTDFAYRKHTSLPGSANVLRLDDKINPNDQCLLSTVLLEENPSILSLSVVSPALLSSVTVELDLSSCLMFAGTAKVNPFQMTPNIIRLLLVDSNGFILKINLHWESLKKCLTPQTVTFHSWHKNLTKEIVGAVHPHAINQALVGFLSESCVLLALNPFLIGIDIDQDDKVTFWSFGACVDAMHRRNTSMSKGSSVLSLIPGMKVGGVGGVAPLAPGTFIDMNPISALAVATTHGDNLNQCDRNCGYNDKDNDSSVVTTLHNDGCVRIWIVSIPLATSPFSVVESFPCNLPHSDLWSSEQQSSTPIIISRLYQYHVLSVLSIPTSTFSRQAYSKMSAEIDCRHHLSAIRANIFDIKNSRDALSVQLDSLTLELPRGAKSLISMDFHSHSIQCSFLAWFHMYDHAQQQRGPAQNQSAGTDHPIAASMTTTCVHYPPSQSAILGTKPILFAAPEMMLDHLVVKERESIQLLQPPGAVVYSYTLSDAMTSIDQFFLRWLFNPLIRPITSLQTPSATHIRNALRRIMPIMPRTSAVGSFFFASSQSESRDIELQVLLGMRFFLKKNLRHRQQISQTPTSLELLKTTPDHDTSDASRPMSTICLKNTPFTRKRERNVYDLVGLRTNGRISPSMKATDSDARDFDNDDEYLVDQSKDTQERLCSANHSVVIHQYVTLWKKLLDAIWLEQENLRFPLLLTTNISATLMGNNAAVTIRNGAISVIAESLIPALCHPCHISFGKQQRLKGFALAASGVMDIVSHDRYLSNIVSCYENVILQEISNGDLAINGALPKCEKLNIVVESLKARNLITRQQRLSVNAFLSQQTSGKLIKVLETLSAPGLTERPDFSGSMNSLPNGFEIGHQFRLSCSGFVARNLKLIQCQLMGQLLLLKLFKDLSCSCLVETAFRQYLQVVSLRSVFAQRIDNSVHQPLIISVIEGFGALSNQRKNGFPEMYLLDAFIRNMSALIVVPKSCGCSLTSFITSFSIDVLNFCFHCNSGSSFHTNRTEEIFKLLSNLFQCPKSHLTFLSPHLVLRRTSDDSFLVATQLKNVTKALLLCAAKGPEDLARVMSFRALELFLIKNDGYLLDERLMKELNEMNELVVTVQDEVVTSFFLDYLEVYASSVTPKVAATPDCSMWIEQIWSLVLAQSMTICDWIRSFKANCNITKPLVRINNFKNLARAMISSGFLAELQLFCEPDDASKRHFSGVIDRDSGPGTYEAVAETMAEISVYDVYSDLVTCANYDKALYALDTINEKWIRAGQALDVSYCKAIEILRCCSKEIDLSSMKDCLCNLRLSAIGRRNVVAVESGEDDSKGLITGERVLYLGYPMNMHSHSALAERRLRPLSHEVQYHNVNRNDRLIRFSDLDTLASMILAFFVLLKKERVDTQLVSFLSCISHYIPSDAEMVNIIEKLCLQGHYVRSMVLMKLVSFRLALHETIGRGEVFCPWFRNFLCNHLTSIALKQSADSLQPILKQFTESLNALSSHHSSLPPLLYTRRSIKPSALASHCLRIYAEELLQALTIEYTSSCVPLAIYVAEYILSKRVSIPLWLDSLLLYGAVRIFDRIGDSISNGLFARRRRPDLAGRRSNCYLGDPSALLNLYMSHGYLVDACRVATTILNEPQRKQKAPCRLPEIGDLDYVPYVIIDELWKLIEVYNKKLISDPVKVQRFLASRKNMGDAMLNHFCLLKITEEGLQSSRVLLMYKE